MTAPQIVIETGVSADYWNEYHAKVMRLDKGLRLVAEIFKQEPVNKYEQRFNKEKYEELITTQNKARVKRLNELADLVNENFTDTERFTELNFKIVINEVHNLIYGKGENYFYPEATA